jgi:hypothetical protein
MIAKAESGTRTRPFNKRKYAALLAESIPTVIGAEAEYDRAIAEIEKLLKKSARISAEEEHLLDLLSPMEKSDHVIRATCPDPGCFDLEPGYRATLVGNGDWRRMPSRGKSRYSSRRCHCRASGGVTDVGSVPPHQRRLRRRLPTLPRASALPRRIGWTTGARRHRLRLRQWKNVLETRFEATSYGSAKMKLIETTKES